MAKTMPLLTIISDSVSTAWVLSVSAAAACPISVSKLAYDKKDVCVHDHRQPRPMHLSRLRRIDGNWNEVNPRLSLCGDLEILLQMVVFCTACLERPRVRIGWLVYKSLDSYAYQNKRPIWFNRAWWTAISNRPWNMLYLRSTTLSSWVCLGLGSRQQWLPW